MCLMSGFEYEQSNGESNFEIPTIRVHRRQLSGSQILKENARIKSLQLEIYLEQETFPDEEINLSYRSNQMTNITTSQPHQSAHHKRHSSKNSYALWSTTARSN